MTYKKFKKIWDEVAAKYPNIKITAPKKGEVGYESMKLMAAYGRGGKRAKDHLKMIDRILDEHHKNEKAGGK